ncbi:MAG: hypothetical protein COB54_00105 [Alphaproteobacteria bacterium]|nr:MAG: hypothetical protein COB54_00105 [Alphaproteobacteria bacterium]
MTSKMFILLTTTAISITGASTPSAYAAGELEEIIVTAQKRAQDLGSIGIAINAFTGDQMSDLGINDATDLALFTPGLSLTETGVTGVPVYTIRGVGFDDYNANSSSTVGLYTDEIGLPYATMSRGPLFDMNQIEVLKGPQGTLYGRNTTGGAINFLSNKPTEEYESGMKVGYGRYQTFDLEGYVSGQITKTLNARLSGMTTQASKGWQQSTSRDDTLGKQDVAGARLLLDWQASEDISALFRFHWYRDKSDNIAPKYFAYVPLVPDLAPYFPAPDASLVPDPQDPRAADWSASLRPERDNEGYGASVKLDWETAIGTLTSISAYEGFSRYETNDWDGSHIENLDVIMDTEISSWSQELRLASAAEDNNLSWIFGGYYSQDSMDESWQALGSQSTVFLGTFGTVDTRYHQEADTLAAFGHMEYLIDEQFRISVGLRYTHESREFSSCTYDVDGGLAGFYNADLGAIPGLVDHIFLTSTPMEVGSCSTVDTSRASFTVDPVSFEVSSFGGVAEIFTDKTTINNLSGRLGLDWMPNDDTLVYLSYSKGFKSGGYNGAAASTWEQLAPYREEKINAFEAGFKVTVLDGSMRLNGSVFRYDYTDKQIVGFIADDVFGLLTQLVNVPKAEITGAEAELEWQPDDRFYFRFGAAYLDSEVKEYSGLDGTGNLRDFSGMELAQTATWQLNGLAAYQYPVSEGLLGSLSVDFNYNDQYQSAIDNSPLFFVDSYFVWNARLGLSDAEGRWDASVWGRNLSNKSYYTSANLSNDYWFRSPGRGMTWGATLSYNW